MEEVAEQSEGYAFYDPEEPDDDLDDCFKEVYIPEFQQTGDRR